MTCAAIDVSADGDLGAGGARASDSAIASFDRDAGDRRAHLSRLPQRRDRLDLLRAGPRGCSLATGSSRAPARAARNPRPRARRPTTVRSTSPPSSTARSRNSIASRRPAPSPSRPATRATSRWWPARRSRQRRRAATTRGSSIPRRWRSPLTVLPSTRTSRPTARLRRFDREPFVAPPCAGHHVSGHDRDRETEAEHQAAPGDLQLHLDRVRVELRVLARPRRLPALRLAADARRKLRRRRHTFEVRAVDAAGNVDPTPGHGEVEGAAQEAREVGPAPLPFGDGGQRRSRRLGRARSGRGVRRRRRRGRRRARRRAATWRSCSPPRRIWRTRSRSSPWSTSASTPRSLIGCGAGGVLGAGRELESGPGRGGLGLCGAPGARIATHHLEAEPADDGIAVSGLPGARRARRRR